MCRKPQSVGVRKAVPRRNQITNPEINGRLLVEGRGKARNIVGDVRWNVVVAELRTKKVEPNQGIYFAMNSGGCGLKYSISSDKGRRTTKNIISV
jgi:hypothetical protein